MIQDVSTVLYIQVQRPHLHQSLNQLTPRNALALWIIKKASANHRSN